MTEKRFEIMVGGMVWDNHVDEDRQLSRDEVVDLLNEQHERILTLEKYLLNEQSETIRQYTDLETQIDIHRAYKMKVKETLQKRYAQLDRITKRYGDMHKPCKDLLAEICKELGVEIDD